MLYNAGLRLEDADLIAFAGLVYEAAGVVCALEHPASAHYPTPRMPTGRGRTVDAARKGAVR